MICKDLFLFPVGRHEWLQQFKEMGGSFFDVGCECDSAANGQSVDSAFHQRHHVILMDSSHSDMSYIYFLPAHSEVKVANSLNS